MVIPPLLRFASQSDGGQNSAYREDLLILQKGSDLFYSLPAGRQGNGVCPLFFKIEKFFLGEGL